MTPDFTNDELSIRLLDPADLIEAKNNNKVHTDESTRKLAKSFAEIGQISPILVDKDHVIISGHGRARAAKALGWSSAKVIVLPVTRDVAIKMRLAENLTSSQQYDTDAIARELAELAQMNVEVDMDALSLDDSLSKLLTMDAKSDFGLNESSLSVDVNSDVENFADENDRLMTVASEKPVALKEVFEAKDMTPDQARDIRDMLAVMMDETNENSPIVAMQKWYMENLA